jgi:arylsulfatase A-like enzyme
MPQRRCARRRGAPSSPGAFSFQKSYLWEGGIRVPAIVRWPGTIPPGRTSDQPVITMDWTATMLEATGTPPAPEYPLDGEDILPVCTGAREPYDRTLFWRTRTRAAARVGKWRAHRAREARHHQSSIINNHQSSIVNHQ